MKLAVPFFHQDTNFTCGPAALEMVLAYYGVRISEMRLRKKLHTESSPLLAGTSHGHLIDLARSLGFFSYANEGAELDEVQLFLHRKMPVLVDYTEPSSDEGHYSVVIGMENDHVILNDPWNGPEFCLTQHRFLERWHDPLTHSRRWMLVLARQDFAMGHEFLPR